MITAFLDRVRRPATCRAGHTWTAMSYPVACSACGRVRPEDQTSATAATTV